MGGGGGRHEKASALENVRLGGVRVAGEGGTAARRGGEVAAGRRRGRSGWGEAEEGRGAAAVGVERERRRSSRAEWRLEGKQPRGGDAIPSGGVR